MHSRKYGWKENIKQIKINKRKKTYILDITAQTMMMSKYIHKSEPWIKGGMTQSLQVPP